MGDEKARCPFQLQSSAENALPRGLLLPPYPCTHSPNDRTARLCVHLSSLNRPAHMVCGGEGGQGPPPVSGPVMNLGPQVPEVTRQVGGSAGMVQTHWLCMLGSSGHKIALSCSFYPRCARAHPPPRAVAPPLTEVEAPCPGLAHKDAYHHCPPGGPRATQGPGTGVRPLSEPVPRGMVTWMTGSAAFSHTVLASGRTVAQ